MAKFCTHCGNKLDENEAFCTVCGAKVEEKPSAAPAAPAPAPAAPAPAPAAPAPAPAPAAPAPRPTPAAAPAAPVPDKSSPTVGVFVYIGLMLLFAVPLIGFLISIIFCFAPKNKSIRHFAVAYVIWTLIGILIFGLIVFAVKKLVDSVADKITENLPDAVSGLLGGGDGLDLGALIGTVGSLGTEDGTDIAGLIGQLAGGSGDLTGMLSEIAGEDVSEEDLQELIDSIKNGSFDFSRIGELIEPAE